MNATTQLINEFLSVKEIAIAGVSRNKMKFGYKVFDLFQSKGYTVYPVNPVASDINGVTCFSSVRNVPANVKSLLIITPHKKNEAVISDALTHGFEHIWIQQKSDSPEALKLIEKTNVKLIKNRCVFMFLEPKGGHAFHSLVFKLLNKI